MVTSRILSVLHRVIPGNGGGTEVVTLHFFGVKMISIDLVWLRVRLLALDHRLNMLQLLRPCMAVTGWDNDVCVVCVFG